MTIYTVSSGVTSSGIILSAGDIEDVLSGGIAVSTTISSGGTEVVSSGGVTSATTVSSGGSEKVSAGGSAHTAVISMGGSETVLGNSISATVLSGGNQIVSSGGVASSATVSSGGVETVLSGGSARTTRVENGGSAVVSGGVISSAIISSGGALFVSSGGLASKTTVSSGGSLAVSSGGSATSTTVRGSGTVATVLSGGTADVTTVSSGGKLTVSSGGVASSATVRTGGVESVQSGGSALATTVSSGGSQTVISGGLASATTVSASGIETVYIGGVVSSATFSSGAHLAEVGLTISGATVTLAPITATTSFSIGAAGTTSNVVSAISATVGSAGTLVVASGGLASATTLSSGGNEIVSSGGTDSAVTLLSGGSETVLGTAISGMVMNGGSQTVSSGGLTSATIVYSGGNAVVSSGGKAKSATVSGGGTLTVFSAGLTSSTTISSGGSAVILAGGSASAATLSSGGGLTVFSGGLASATTVLGGAIETVYVGGVISKATFSSGAELVEVGMTVSGGVTMALKPIITSSSISITSSGTTSNVISALDIMVSSGGSLVVSSGAFASATTVSSGGSETVSSGGIDSGALVLSGGSELVLTSGVADGATVSNGGSQTVSSGGLASGTTVSSGGTEVVRSGGVASGSVIGTGGSATVSSGGTFASAILGSGGTLTVSAAGFASNTSVGSGAREVILAGGSASSDTVSSGGGFVVSSGGLASATTVLTGGGATVYLGGLVSGATFLSGAQLTEVGMTVGAGTTVTLAPITATTSVSIGSAGTTSNVVSAVSATIKSGGTLAVSSGGVASATTVSSGGSAIVWSGGTDISVTVLSGGGETVLSGGVASGTVVSAGGNETINSGGALTGITLDSGADLTEVGLLISGPGETLTLAAIASQVSNFSVPAGGVLSNVVSAVSATVMSGGAVVVTSGGSASATAVSAGGSLTVASSGSAVATTVLNGGTAIVLSGGVELDAVVLSGGAESVSAGGVASATVVSSGGMQTVLSGGTASGSTLNASGAIVLSGGTLAGAAAMPIGSGATLSGFGSVTQGLSGAGAVTAKGGTLDLLGLVGSGPTLAIDSSAPATLQIDNTVTAVSAIAISSSNQTLRVGAAGDLIIAATESITGGTIALSGTLSDAEGVTIGSAGTLAGSGTVAGNTPVTLSGGTVDGTGGGLMVAGGLAGTGVVSGTLRAGSGLIEASTGELQITGAITNGLSLAIDGSTQALLDIGGSAGAATTITFLGAAGELELGDVAGGTLQFGGTIDGLDVGRSATTPANYVNVQGLTITSAVLSSGTITLENGTTAVGTLALGAAPAAGTYAVVEPDSTLGGTDIFLADAPPTVTWSPGPVTGNPYTTIALDSVIPASFDGLQSVVISSIPVGATLSDGTNSFTASSGNSSVNVLGWALSNLTITTADSNFSLGVTVSDLAGNSSATEIEAVAVNALAPTVVPVAETGLEGSAIALDLGVAVNGVQGSASNLASLVVSAIPAGATITDGTNSFTASAGSTSVDVTDWNLASLTITPTNDANLSLGVAAASLNAPGNVTSATEAVTVTPLAPTVAAVAETGVEGSAIALNLGVTVNGLAGDSNSLGSLVVSGVPAGATLSDGAGHSFTASAGSTSADVSGWSYTSLTITPANDSDFTLGVAATAADSEDNLSTTTSSTEAVTVTPLAPTVAPAAETGVEGSAIALNLGVTVNRLAGDSNSLASLVVSAIPVGATLSDGAGHSFTASAGSTSVDVHSWTLSGLKITTTNDTDFTLGVAATTVDGNGNLSTTSSNTEAVRVTPLAPSVAPVAETRVEGAAIALNLGVTVNGLAGDSNSLASLVVSAIPVGATITDGTNSFTASAGSTSVDVSGWSYTSLTITPTNDTDFALGVAATTVDANGNLSTTTSSTEAVTVTPLAPTVAPVAETGVEGSPIALNLGVTVNGLTGDSNTLASLVVSAIPVGATITDGTNSFTASAGSMSVDVHNWNLARLTITPTDDTNFTLGVAAKTVDTNGNFSTTTSSTETVTVIPLAPTVAPVAESGVEGSAIALNLGVTVNGLAGDSNTLAALVVSAIPVGATITDGTNSFTARAGSTSVDVHSWDLSSLTITPTDDTNILLGVAATARDAEGNLGTSANNTEAVTVTPLAPSVAPVAETGVEGSPIALNLGVTVNGLAGDSNSLASLVVSDIPIAATITDGTNSFTASAGSTSVDVHSWALSSLTITPTDSADFALGVAAATADAGGNLSATTTGTEAVVVSPLAPTVTPVAETGAEGSAIALNLGVTVNGLTGDSNTLASLVVSAIPVGATITDGTNSFTASAGSTSVDVSSWTLTSLTITSTNDTDFALSVAATEQDAGGDLSNTTTATETVTVTPVAPSVAPVAESGVEGSAIALNLGVTVNGLAGDSNSLASLVVSAIPAGATLSDGAGHSFTASAGSTSVDVHSWTLSGLKITTADDTDFTLGVAATTVDANGNLSTTTSSTEAVTVAPLAPSVAPVAESGVEGSAIALNLGVTVNGLAGDSNSLASLVVSAIPAGAMLSDGAGHSFTASAGSTSVDVHSWTLSGLKITTADDTDFTLGVAATTVDANGNLSTTTSSTEAVTVAPLAPSVAPVAESGVEGSAIALNLGVTVNGLAGDSNSLASLVVSAIPAGAMLSDGAGHSFTASAGSTSVDVHSWALSSLTITPADSADFALGVAAATADAGGNLSATTTGTEAVVVSPLAPTVTPVAETGAEGSAIALNLGVTVNGLTGDSNTLASLVVSAIPVGATITDGTNSFTASAGSTSVDVSSWTLTSLTITSTNDTDFALSVAATEQDAGGDLSNTTTATETVTVTPLAPAVAPVAESGVEGSTIALNLGVTVNGLAGDANSVASLVVSAIPVGATITDGTNSFTASSGSTSVDVHSWDLSSLTITPTDDADFTLGVAATTVDGNGNLSTTTSSTEAVTVTPLAPSVAPVAESGVEGSAIALNLGVTVNGLAGDSNSVASLVVSAIPAGATLSDGAGHSFTATGGGTSVDVHSWNISGLTITPTDDTDFTLGVAATTVDANGNLSTTTSSTEAVTVTPLAPSVAPVAESGVEGSAIALNLGVTVNGLAGDSNSVASLVVSAIPAGATLSDGAGHSFTATGGGTSVDVHSWNISGLTITPTDDTDFTLGVAATTVDANGNLSTTTSGTEVVTVMPLAPAVAPVAESGVEGSTIALNLGVTVSGLAGDSNSVASLVVSAIPVGATITDGTNSFTASAGSTSVDVHSWDLSSLTITPTDDADFTLGVAATTVDGNGNLSTTTSSTEAVTVTPLAPSVAPVAETGVEGSPIALNLGVTVNGLPGDSNTLASLVVSAIPVGATITDGTNSFTANAGSTSVDVHSWDLSSLTITPTDDANITLGVVATTVDANGNLSTTTSGTEAVTVTPLAPTVVPAAETGVEGSPIALNLGVTVNGLAGDSNSLASLVVSAIPVGATITDGSNSFTASAGSTSVDVSGWSYTSLTITPTDDTNIVLGVAATTVDADGKLSTTTSGTEAVTVTPLAPTVAPAAETGVEGSPIALNLGVTVNGLPGDSNTLASLVVGAMPVGATLTDGHGDSFSASDGTTSIDVSGWSYTNLTITPAADANFTLSVAATEQDAEGNLSSTTSSTEEVTVCYVAGTHILTAMGERKVESLTPGEIVLTLSDTGMSSQPIKWIGRRRIDLATHPRPQTVTPVRIQCGAFADNVPHADLLVSPDHAILVDGRLICARQLINASTIHWAIECRSVEYFHIELESHAILLAEGLPAESYLDTGNRAFFANSGQPILLFPDLTDETDHPTREAGSCAPFVWDEDTVRPIWQRLTDRAAALGQPAPSLDTTADPELHVVAKGRQLHPLYSENGLYVFVLPLGTTQVRLISRASAPADARPWLEDRRCLGVYVERIVLREGSEVQEVPLDHPALLRGWWAVERDDTAYCYRRWTDGDATLPLPSLSGPTILEVRATSGGMLYVMYPDRLRPMDRLVGTNG